MTLSISKTKDVKYEDGSGANFGHVGDGNGPNRPWAATTYKIAVIDACFFF